MKKWTLLSVILACSMWATVASSQSFVLDWQDPPMTIPSNSSVVTSYGQFRNVSGSQKSILFKADFTSCVPEHSMRICFGDLCYFVFPDALPDERDPFNMPANSTESLKAQMVPYDAMGSSTIGYTIFDKDNPTDTLRYNVTFIVTTPNSVGELTDLDITVGPNPSASAITVRGADASSILALNLYTAEGRLRRTFPVTNAPVSTLDVSDIASGSYHLMITMPGGEVYRAPVIIAR
jgi:hypothetical protein